MQINRILLVVALTAAITTAKAQAVNVTLSEWKLEFGRDTVQAGAVTFKVKNTGSMAHSFYVSGNGVEKGSKEIAAGQTGTLTITLTPGTYDTYCPLADMTHKMAGLKRNLVVVAGSAAVPAKKPGA